MSPNRIVLLVEDNSGDARLLREMLYESGSNDTELVHVSSMREAELYLAEHAVDIVLLDPGLPDARGLEAVRRVRAATPRIPLVVLTGLDDEGLAAQALQEGAQDYLIKGQTEARGLMRALRYSTERKRLEQLKDEFVSSVSHELRTPLTSISGALGLLMGNAAEGLPKPAARLVAIAHKNCQRLVRLVNDILDIEKMESGQAIFNFKRVEVGSLVEQTIEDNRGFATGYNVRIRLDPLPAGAEVRADPDRLVQVFTNLISNAVKFSPTGAEVIVAVEQRSETVRITVRDSGLGISDEFKPHIFEKFAQADNSDARQKGGTGLGLSIVKQIIDRLGGSVGFEDAPGGGAIFYVELRNWTNARRAGDKDVRILLCEGDTDAAIVLCDRLRHEGFLADVAFTAADAVTRAGATAYSAILVDLQIPDGIDLIKQLRAQPQISNTLLVVLSADPNRIADDPKASTLLNILDWLDAPLDVTHLARILDRPIVRNGRRRPRLLHIDDDRETLRNVAQALDATAEVMSADSIAEAQRVLAANRFDVAVLNVALVAGSGFDLLHELRDEEGDAIPLIVFSSPDANRSLTAQVGEALIKSRTSVDDLVATLHRRIAGRSPTAPSKKEAA
jgi:signal transduction histidine kinase